MDQTNFVQKAVWFVESHFRENISLENVARACGVSAYHLTRVFAATTGYSLMRYVRGRRLSVAAIELAKGAPDILDLALDVGYGSHEAFSRAFRDQFGVTPEQLRAGGRVDQLKLIEEIPMSQNSTIAFHLPPPKIEKRSPLFLAGLLQQYKCEPSVNLADQWQRFVPYIGNIDGQIGATAYGAVFDFNEQGDMKYLTGVEVTETATLPVEFETLRIPTYDYAIFTHTDHIASIKQSFAAIWNGWFPGSGYRAIPGPTLEVYGPEFDGRTGLGGLQIWIPVAAV